MASHRLKILEILIFVIFQMFDAVDRMGQIVEDSLAISSKNPSSNIYTTNHESEEGTVRDQLTPEEIYRLRNETAIGKGIKSEEEMEKDREREKKREWEKEKERRVGVDSVVLAGYKVIAVGGGSREKDHEREMEMKRDRYIAREREREKDDLINKESVRKVEERNEVKNKLELENDRIKRMIGREGSLLKMNFQHGSENTALECRNRSGTGRLGGKESFLLKDDGDGTGVKWVSLGDQASQQEIQDPPVLQYVTENYSSPALISE